MRRIQKIPGFLGEGHRAFRLRRKGTGLTAKTLRKMRKEIFGVPQPTALTASVLSEIETELLDAVLPDRSPPDRSRLSPPGASQG